MNCPKCESAMEIKRYDYVHVDRCTNCKGIWFDLAEIEHLKKLKGSESIDIGKIKIGKEFNAIKDINCPKCSVKLLQMRDSQQTHIAFEKCPSCHGVFLDAGEFKDLNSENILDYIKAIIS